MPKSAPKQGQREITALRKRLTLASATGLIEVSIQIGRQGRLHRLRIQPHKVLCACCRVSLKWQVLDCPGNRVTRGSGFFQHRSNGFSIYMVDGAIIGHCRTAVVAKLEQHLWRHQVVTTMRRHFAHDTVCSMGLTANKKPSHEG